MTGQTIDLLTVLYNKYFNYKYNPNFNPTEFFKYLSYNLGCALGDRRYKLKPLAYSNMSMLIQYKGVKYYIEHDFNTGEWIANYY